MRHGLAKLLREGHRFAGKRRYRRRGGNEQTNIQNVGLSFCSTAFVLIQSVQLAARHMTKTSQFWGSRLCENSKYGQRDCLSGRAPDFSEKYPRWGLFERPAQAVK